MYIFDISLSLRQKTDSWHNHACKYEQTKHLI